MTSNRPPQGFTPLVYAVSISNKNYDVIGVCVDYLEPTKSKGTDYTCQFTLYDPSWLQDRGMKFRFFNSAIDKLPKIHANGDVLILRNVMTKVIHGQPQGMSNSNTSWVVVSGSTILESTCPHGSDIAFVASGNRYSGAPPPTPEQIEYAKIVVRLADPPSFKPPPSATSLEIENRIKAAGGVPPPRPNKWQLIQDLTPIPKFGNTKFADLFGEVRKTWYNDYGRGELHLTDYTANKLLYSYSEQAQAREGDVYGYSGSLHERWPGPWGRMTIDVTLYDAHAEYARAHVKAGTYVLIRNCVIKLDSNGSRLEALCRGDRNDMTRVNVQIFHPHQAEGDQRFKDLLKRRLEYEKLAKAKGQRFGFGQQESNKRSFGDIQSNQDKGASTEDIPVKASKRSKKRKNKASKQATGLETTTDTAADNSTQLNRNVRCNSINVPLKSISSILDLDTLERKTQKSNSYILPFQNSSYKCKVRVVDYYPNNLIDFSVPHLVSDYDALSDHESTTSNTEEARNAAQDNPHTVRWEWRFFLVVEDASPRPVNPTDPSPQMALLVADQDGDFLLRDEATDLRNKPQDLAKLREKLFLLWGDLQERKEEAAAAGQSLDVKVQAQPFECFIKEYGIPLSIEQRKDDSAARSGPNYQRMFRLFGTSI